MLIDVNRYSSSLKKLWADVFGDSDDYIRLLFDCGYTPCECFAEVSDSEVISALYLLKGYIDNGNESYEGRYLYAAATAENHRGKGLMAKLIKEAQNYVASNNISFISLVPANEGLYGYYSRFGFEAVMKNYIAVADGKSDAAIVKKTSPDKAYKIRRGIDAPCFRFADGEWKYAVSCLRYAGYEFIENTDSSYFLINDRGDEVLEYVSTSEDFNENIQALLRRLGAVTQIVSPYDLSDCCECKENRFGMVFFADEKMKNNLKGDIYMNIALD